MEHVTMVYGVPIFLLIFCVCNIGVVFGEEAPLVTIRNGTLEGSILKTKKGREFASFRGIPYAQSPVGDLRFEPPQPFGSWRGVRLAKEDTSVCMQPSGTTSVGNEDCLYLNVYRPKLTVSAENRTFPVMIFFHGGGWISGSANSGLYGPQYLLDHDLVLVTVNYRLGSLGFFSTEDLVCPGNQGLKDQGQSIRWVHENIAAFNGDPNNVTIFGESSGAVSVHFHMINRDVRDLFHRTITQSGDVLSPAAVTRPGLAKEQSFAFGTHLNCTARSSSELLRCLKTKNASDISRAVCPNQGLFGTCPIRPFRPVIEGHQPGAYITEEPARSLESGNIANIPWMTGINAQEGGGFASAIYGVPSQHFAQQLDKNFLTLAPQTMLYDVTCPVELLNNVSTRIRHFYFGDHKIDVSVKWQLIDMYTDAHIFIGDQVAVKKHLQKLTAPVYYYLYDYKGINSFSQLYGDLVNDYGVCHADDLLSLFPVYRQLFPNSSPSAEDSKVIDVMTQLWFNFAKTGNPTPEKTPLLPVQWTPVRTASLQYFHIRNSTDLRMEENLFPERVEFWASLPYRANIKVTNDCNRLHKKGK